MSKGNPRMVVRLPEEERSLLVRKAQIAGVTVSEFMRELIIKSDDAADLSMLKKALATLADTSLDDADQQAGAIAMVMHTATRMAEQRGFLTFKETGLIISQIAAAKGKPSAHIKVTEEGRHLHAHAASEKTWEQMIADKEARLRGGAGDGDSSAVPGSADPSVLDVDVLSTRELVAAPPALTESRNGQRRRGETSEG